MPTFTDHDVLVVLTTARDSIAAAETCDGAAEALTTDYWDYGCWSSCTCGHIYGAAMNAQGKDPLLDEEGVHKHGAAEWDMDRLYTTVLERVDRAVTGHPDFDRKMALSGDALAHWRLAHRDEDAPMYRVSDLTAALTPGSRRPHSEQYRKAALWMIDVTIETIQREHRAAMAECAAATPQPADTEPVVA